MLRPNVIALGLQANSEQCNLLGPNMIGNAKAAGLPSLPRRIRKANFVDFSTHAPQSGSRLFSPRKLSLKNAKIAW